MLAEPAVEFVDGYGAELAVPAPAAVPPPAAISRDEVIEVYHRCAPIYDLVFGLISEPGRRRMAREVSHRRPERLLEVGVGTGLTLARYPRDTAVVGIDLSEDMLRLAERRRRRLADREIALYRMDAERMEFPDGAFDVVVAPYVMTVTPDPRRLVAELRRVCRRDGTIVLLNHFGGSRAWSWLDRVCQPLARRFGFRSEFDYHEHVASHDWQVESCREVNLLGLSKLVVIRNV